MNFRKGILCFGALLAVIQYGSDRSIWMDEAKLALNIIDRSYLELMAPLHSNQIAPILFLWIEKFLGQLGGYQAWSLRLFPLCCYLGSLWLFYKLLGRVTSNTRVQLVACTLVAACQPLIYYASEAKQYMVDVFVTLGLLYLILYPFASSRKQLGWLSIAGIIAIGLSNIAVIMLLICGIYLWHATFTKTGNVFNKSLVPGSLWIVAFGGIYLFFLHDHPNRQYMQPFWEYAFMPSNPFTASFWQWGYDRYRMLFGELMGANLKVPFLYQLYGVCYVIGAYALLKCKKYKLLFLFIGPIMVHLLLSALALYPFEERVLLYIQPLLAIVVAFGVVFLFEIVQAKVGRHLPTQLLLLPGLALLIITLYTFPKDREEFKEAYRFMSAHIKPNDQIFLNAGSDNAWEFYEKTGYIDLSNRLIQSGYHRDNFSKHIPQLQGLTGQVWFFFTHDYKEPATGQLETSFIKQALEKLGTLSRKQNYIGAEVFLFIPN